MSVRKTVKKMKAAVVSNGSEAGYDNEDDEYDEEESHSSFEYNAEEYGDEDQEVPSLTSKSVYYNSQQLDEVYDIVCHPARADLIYFLVKDRTYNWEYTNKLIKKQIRSKSVDLVVPYQGEFIPKNKSSKYSDQGHDSKERPNE